MFCVDGEFCFVALCSFLVVLLCCKGSASGSCLYQFGRGVRARIFALFCGNMAPEIIRNVFGFCTSFVACCLVLLFLLYVVVVTAVTSVKILAPF